MIDSQVVSEEERSHDDQVSASNRRTLLAVWWSGLSLIMIIAISAGVHQYGNWSREEKLRSALRLAKEQIARDQELSASDRSGSQTGPQSKSDESEVPPWEQPETGEDKFQDSNELSLEEVASEARHLHLTERDEIREAVSSLGWAFYELQGLELPYPRSWTTRSKIGEVTEFIATDPETKDQIEFWIHPIGMFNPVSNYKEESSRFSKGAKYQYHEIRLLSGETVLRNGVEWDFTLTRNGNPPRRKKIFYFEYKQYVLAVVLNTSIVGERDLDGGFYQPLMDTIRTWPD